MRRIACISFAAVAALTSLASAEKPRLFVVDVPPHPAVTEAVAPYNTIFLNRCANGCTVTGPGTTDSRIDKSAIVTGSHVLTKFTYGDATWNSLVACVRDVFSPFNVQITDVDPGSANHFEIMIGGNPQDLGFGANIGGVSANGCGD